MEGLKNSGEINAARTMTWIPYPRFTRSYRSLRTPFHYPFTDGRHVLQHFLRPVVAVLLVTQYNHASYPSAVASGARNISRCVNREPQANQIRATMQP